MLQCLCGIRPVYVACTPVAAKHLLSAMTQMHFLFVCHLLEGSYIEDGGTYLPRLNLFGRKMDTNISAISSWTFWGRIEAWTTLERKASVRQALKSKIKDHQKPTKGLLPRARVFRKSVYLK